MVCYTVFHFAFFLILEEVINSKTATVIHCAIDDYIPFCEYFIVPYLLWFLYIPLVLFSLLFKDRESFWKMTTMMFGGNIICLIFYAIFPNTVETKYMVEETNIFAALVNILYANDTPTNVCPSMHVLDTLAAHIALCRSVLTKKFPFIKIGSFIFLMLICIATVTLKQHSIIDVFAAFGLMFVMVKIAYRDEVPVKNRLQNKECF